ncbi:LacI family transcriptional regulator [Mucilaginibacter roseus]|uniref:LacI family transcriptional regulator n=1 Tax=Mucilaginibacter roseus TaxID=1528868 RepID=A0ABS8U1H3_9SPHI|nr:LacI family DNA-binding transcriptional regulator [Mucilaginibacter roseus]MCD8739935.1 LacI family transcriptional regulator [Mucilaginibacter roseus]
MEKITIKLLAKSLNVSIATVSKSFTGSHEVSEATRKRVLDLAKELDFVPNAYAGSLRGHKSKTIAVLIPEVADSFFSTALNGIEEVTLEKGYQTLICLTHEKLEKEQALLKELANGRVDGVIMSVSSETNSFDHINAFIKKLPIVFFDRVCAELKTACITTNDFECGYIATRHLIEAGCKRIALLSISNALSIISERSKGFQKAIDEYGLDTGACSIINCSQQANVNYQLISELMSGPDRPDGIVATVEKLTTEIYMACADLGVNIPNQVKVICFSNQSSAGILNPSLTTITQPAFEMGKAAAKALLRGLKNKELDLTDESTVIPSVLTVRNSTVRKK